MGFIPLVVVRSCAVKWISQELSRCQSSGVSLRMLRRTQVQRSLSTDSSPAGSQWLDVEKKNLMMSY